MTGVPDLPRVAVLIGSTRPSRICPDIAGWVCGVLQMSESARYELLDLADVDLPLLDEPLMAARQRYAHAHTRAWSSLVAGYRGFVFVVPQYNWGYPAAFKNALDYLYVEWHGKPATTVTYGTRGGAKAADQIHQVLCGLHMAPLPDRVEVAIADDQLDADFQLRDPAATMEPYRAQIRRIDAALTAALRAAP